MKRRDLLKTGAIVLGSTQLSACESIYSRISKEMGEKIPSNISVAESANIDPAYHFLSRTAYGAWPGDIEMLKARGYEAWLDEQLAPEKIDDRACELRARRFETLQIPPGACFDFKKEALRKDVVRHTLLRAVYSRRQLLEVLVGFWTDHLNISLDKGDCIYLKPSDDRLVIRQNALGKFRDLIQSSSTSPAMLVYLDGKENRKSGEHELPNENYGRELLELHTMGVHGGYTQKDVFEVARCFTGWRLHDKWQRAKVYFDPKLHDDGEKHVLGQAIPAGGGAGDRDRVLDIVCSHPATASFVSGKLASHFVNEPSLALRKKAADVFAATAGDIAALVKSILLSEEFMNDRGTKLKRPFHFVASSLRALAADTHAHQDLVEYLQRMGQAPFQYPTPDGYPDDANFWTGTLLWRWKFAIALASGGIESVKVEIDELLNALGIHKKGPQELQKLFSYFCGRTASKNEFASLDKFIGETPAEHSAHKAELVGLIISSPSFQRY